MKKALLLFTILIFSSQITLAMKGKTGIRQMKEVERIERLENEEPLFILQRMIHASDERIIQYLNSLPEESDIYFCKRNEQNIFNWILRYAASSHYGPKAMFALEHGATHHIYALFRLTTKRDIDMKILILTNCVFQPHPKCIAASRKTCITFLCSMKHKSVSKDIQLLILQHLEDTGNCMIDRALRGKLIPEKFLPITQKTLFITTFKELRRLLHEELEARNRYDSTSNTIRSICAEHDLTKEIQETVIRRLQAPKLICNGICDDIEEKQEDWCTIV